MIINRKRKPLYGLNHSEYEHPFDKQALNTLEATPGLSAIGKLITKYTIEKLYTIQFTGSSIKVNSQNYPDIFEYLQYACHILDLVKLPELYIQWGYNINACTIGSEHPIIILNSGLLDLCDEDEILFIVGHECGHIKSNHMLYHMMAKLSSYIIHAIPGGNIISAPLQFALYYWSRMSEFTADRAGLLCCQNMKAVAKTFIKMSGLPINQYNNINPQTFIEQSREFQQMDYEKLNKIIKFISILPADHPWTVMRTSQLIDWVDSGAIKKIMNSH